MASEILNGRTYWFYNWASTTTMDLYGGKAANETPVQGYRAHFDKGNNQQWLAISTDNGYFILQNVASGTVLDLAGSSSSNQTPINGYQRHGGNNQQWSFTQVSSSGQTPSFSIVNRASGTAVDLYNGGSANETRIYGWTRDSSGQNPHQRWIAIPASPPAAQSE